MLPGDLSESGPGSWYSLYLLVSSSSSFFNFIQSALVLFFLLLFYAWLIVANYSCVRCLTRRQCLSRKNDVGQEEVRRPKSEGIEHIYRSIEISPIKMTHMKYRQTKHRKQTPPWNEQQTLQDNDMAVSRSAKSHSGVYDLAWPGTS